MLIQLSRTRVPLQYVGVSGAMAASAIFQMVSTTQGAVLAPVMTTAQKNAIATPTTGLVVYDSNLGRLEYYNGAAWGAVGGAVGTYVNLQATTPGTAQTGHINISGTVIATTFSGALSGTATNATNVGVTDDTITAAIMYLAWFTGASGNLPAKISSTKLRWNPGSGEFTLYSTLLAKLKVIVGDSQGATGYIRFQNIANSFYFDIISGATGANLSWTLPIAAPGGNGYLLNVSTAGIMGYTDPATWLGLHATADAATLWGAYAAISGPTAARTYTLPDVSSTILSTDTGSWLVNQVFC